MFTVFLIKVFNKKSLLFSPQCPVLQVPSVTAILTWISAQISFFKSSFLCYCVFTRINLNVLCCPYTLEDPIIFVLTLLKRLHSHCLFMPNATPFLMPQVT